MEKDVQLGPEAKGVFKIENGRVILGVSYVGTQASADANVSLGIEQFAQLLKDAIPGKIDDTVIDLLVAAMKAL